MTIELKPEQEHRIEQAMRSGADRIESVIHSRFAHLADFPGAGHWRGDLTPAMCGFFGLLLLDCVLARDEAYADRQRIAWRP